MKVKVIRVYRDKKTKAVQNPGDEIEVNKTRFAELTAAKGGPYVEEVKDTPPAPPTPPAAESENGSTLPANTNNAPSGGESDDE